MDLRRRSVGGVDDEVGLFQRALSVAALVRRRFGDVAIRVEAGRHVADRFLQIDDVREQLVVDLDQAQRLDRGLLVVGRDRGDLITDEADLFAEDRFLTAERRLGGIEAVQDVADARELLGLLCVDAPHARPRIRAAQHADVEHSEGIDVLRVPGTARDALHAVDAAPRFRDLREFRARRVER